MGSWAAIKVAVLHNEPFVAAGLVDMLRKEGDFILAPPLEHAGHPDWLAQSGTDVVVADYESALELLATVRRQSGRHAASARDVLRLVTEGCCNKTVARRLAITPDTVKTHMKAIFQKLEANNRTEAAAVAERRGLFKQPGARSGVLN
jgi:DNA-binding NarL/FixJ family response regulator